MVLASPLSSSLWGVFFLCAVEKTIILPKFLGFKIIHTARLGSLGILDLGDPPQF